MKTSSEWAVQNFFAPVFEEEPLKTKKPVGKPTGYNQHGGVEGVFIYPLETIELILPVLVDEYLFCISSQDAFQGFGKVCASKGYEKGSRAPLFLCVPKRHGYSSSGNAFSLFQSVFPQLRVES
ncbi:MAG: hypothetical protein IJC28_03895 [Mailhella sp.]|nr:hypothetical protein [Mailhella sp.]MBQ4326038.1 hypothetical protein [Mailhella sp.]